MNDEVEILRAALAALKDAGVGRAQLELGDLKLNVEFVVSLPLEAVTPGAPPAPGGWKGPSDLDAGFQDPQ